MAATPGTSLERPPARADATHLRQITERFFPGPRGQQLVTYRGIDVGSAYQPVYELAGGRLAGHEALLRCSDETIQPELLFQVTDYYYETLDVDDALCLLHLCNYIALGPGGHGRIFVNTHPQTLSNPVKAEALQACVESLGLSFADLALELAEDQIEDLDGVIRAVEPFRALGCTIVANGYHAGRSSLERVWMLRPHLVKFEGSMLPAHSPVPDSASLLSGLVAMFRAAGIRTAIKGIESEADLAAAVRAGMDLAQGFYLHRPVRDRVPLDGAARVAAALARLRA